jgi:hypothetical protein
MRCVSCGCVLTEKEQSRKWENHEKISNPESKYVNLCDGCYNDAFAGDDTLDAFVLSDLEAIVGGRDD